MPPARHTVVTMMKDEGPFLLEWLAYHRLIGIDRVIVYSNDCRDGTDAMLDRLEAMGLVRHRRNLVPAGRAPQPHALRLASRDPDVLHSDWLAVMDADEFLHVKCGDGTLAALTGAVPAGTTGIALTWRVMGSNGHVGWNPGPVLSSYTRGAPDGFRKGWGVKTLVRPFEGMRLGIHRPRIAGMRRDPACLARMEAMPWVNGSGQPMPPTFLRDGWRGSAATVGYGLAEMAHFAVKSREAYLLRRDRGNVNLKPDKYDAAYFAIFDRNEVRHDGLTRFAATVQAQSDDWLHSDPALAGLHASNLAWHDERIATLRARPDHAATMAALERAAAVPYEALDTVLFTQPLPPRGKDMVAQMRAKGMPDAEIAAEVARSVRGLEAARDAAERAELVAMGVLPAS